MDLYGSFSILNYLKANIKIESKYEKKKEGRRRQEKERMERKGVRREGENEKNKGEKGGKRREDNEAILQTESN